MVGLDYLTYENISQMKKSELKKLVISSVNQLAFTNLISLKNSKSKIKHIHYKEFKMQEYLRPNQTTNDTARFVFHARSRMLNLRDNYPSQFSQEDNYCQSCLDKSTKESQQHIAQCSALSTGEISINEIKYDNLFSEQLDKQIQISEILKTRLTKRTAILKDSYC